ncbi:MAG: hypothetical protein SFZ23_06325 [Planctomycetota bacterium]|nr:hypothetical protein [Planctomycetota bacterium]
MTSDLVMRRRSRREFADSRRRAEAPAFSLVELVATMVIIATAATSVCLVIARLSSTRERAAANQLVRDLEFARGVALASGVRAWVRFNLADDSYTIVRESTSGSGLAGAAAVADPGTGAAFAENFADDGSGIVSISIPGGLFDVGFDTRGRPIDSNATLLSSDASVTLSGGHVVTITARTGLTVMN